MNKLTRIKLEKVILVTAASAVSLFGYVNTKRTFEHKPTYSVSEAIVHASGSAKQHALLSLHRQADLEHQDVKHSLVSHHRAVKTGEPSAAEQRRMEAVTKYMNTNDRKHGIKRVRYDPHDDKLSIQYQNTGKPTRDERDYAKRIEHKLDAD